MECYGEGKEMGQSKQLELNMKKWMLSYFDNVLGVIVGSLKILVQYQEENKGNISIKRKGVKIASI